MVVLFFRNAPRSTLEQIMTATKGVEAISLSKKRMSFPVWSQKVKSPLQFGRQWNSGGETGPDSSGRSLLRLEISERNVYFAQ